MKLHEIIEVLKALKDQGRAEEMLKVVRATGISDVGSLVKHWAIERWNSDEDRERKLVYPKGLALEMFKGMPQLSHFWGNQVTTEGMDQLFTILCSSGGTKYDAATAQCGTGTSSTGEAYADSSLTAGVWKGMMASFPTYGSSRKATWKSEFLSAEANQAWNEFSVRNGSGTDLMLNRKVSAQGTKSSGQVWELTLDLTFN